MERQPINEDVANVKDKISESMITTLKTTLKNFIQIEKIGGGSYGDVYKAYHQINKSYFAIKVIDKIKILSSSEGQYGKNILKRLLESEGILMQMCSSPYVVKCYDIKQSNQYKIFVLQYCNRGSLHDELIKRKSYPVNQALAILKQIIKGLSQLHRNKIIHRDLKAENILINDGTYKIADFGFSKKIDAQDRIRAFTVLGTSTTMAPQVKNRSKYGIKADIWSIGVIFYTMICSHIKYNLDGFTGRSADIYKQIYANHDLNFLTIDGNPDQQLKHFIKSMLNMDQSKRLSWRQLITHRIFIRCDKSLFINPVINPSLQQPQVIIIDDYLQAYEDVLSKQINLQNQRSDKRTNFIITETVLSDDEIEEDNHKPDVKSEMKNLDVKSSNVKANPRSSHVLYKKIQKNNLQCLKSFFINDMIIQELINNKVLDLTKRSHYELLYLLITRCYTNISWAENNLKQHLNDEMFISYHQQLKQSYDSIKQKWSSIQQQLFKLTGSLINILSDVKDSIFNRQKKKNLNKFFGGIEPLDYTKEQQVTYTQIQYINSILGKLHNLPKPLQARLKCYQQINQISLEKLQQQEVNFYEKIKSLMIQI